MTDPIAVGAVGATAPTAHASPTAGSTPSAGAQTAKQPDPAETRTFATLMHGVPTSVSQGPSSLSDAARAYAAQLSGNVRSHEEIRRSMLESIDLNDPIKTMFVMTDHSLQAHSMFTRLHVSTGLANAATSLFGTLLKNQQ
jgi:hypothetical protein